MKRFIYILFFAVLTSLSSLAQEINWLTLEKAIELQKKSPKKIMIDVYTSWCGPCKMLDKNTFHNADVVKYVNANYYAVKFNAEGNESVNPGEIEEIDTNGNYAKVGVQEDFFLLVTFFKFC